MASLHDIALSGAVAGIYFKRVYSGLLSTLAHSIYASLSIVQSAGKSIRGIMGLGLVLKLKLVLPVVKRICIYMLSICSDDQLRHLCFRSVCQQNHKCAQNDCRRSAKHGHIALLSFHILKVCFCKYKNILFSSAVCQARLRP